MHFALATVPGWRIKLCVVDVWWSSLVGLLGRGDKRADLEHHLKHGHHRPAGCGRPVFSFFFFLDAPDDSTAGKVRKGAGGC
jgi:hypothetical protein